MFYCIKWKSINTKKNLSMLSNYISDTSCIWYLKHQFWITGLTTVKHMNKLQQVKIIHFLLIKPRTITRYMCYKTADNITKYSETLETKVYNLFNIQALFNPTCQFIINIHAFYYLWYRLITSCEPALCLLYINFHLWLYNLHNTLLILRSLKYIYCSLQKKM